VTLRFAPKVCTETESNEARREAREAERQFKQSLAGKVAVKPGKAVKRPSIYNRPKSDLTPDQLERVRRSANERQGRWRAKRQTAGLTTRGRPFKRP
jgi:hypothetical protein